MNVKYANFVRTTLTGAVATGDLTIVVASASGLPAIVPPEFYRLVLTRMSDLTREIVKVTAVSGTTLTVTRAQESTTALAFDAADRVENWITAGTLDDLAQEFNDISDNASLIANEALGIASAANTLAADAKQTANGIASTAQAAVSTAQSALDIVNALVVQISGAGVATGSVQMFPVETVPVGYLECAGQLITTGKTLYPNLYTFLKDGTPACIYGETTTGFYLPDMRGLVPRGWDHGKLLDPDKYTRTSRLTAGTGTATDGDRVGTKQMDALQVHAHITPINWVGFNDDGTGGPPDALDITDRYINDPDRRHGKKLYGSGDPYGTNARVSFGANGETRMKNINVMFCIKT